MMKNISDLLRGCALFEGVEANDLSAMLRCLDAREVSVSRNEALFSEGAPARDVGILLSGRVQLVRTDYYGNRSIMHHIEPGQLFGEAFACAGVEALPISAVAAEDSRAVLIDCRRIMTSCNSACSFHSRIIFNLLKIVANKNLAMHQKAMIVSRRTTREKLMAYLLLQAKQAGSAHFAIPFDRQGLADFLEVDRSGLSAEISKLKRLGILDCYKNEFRLLDVQKAEK